MLRKLRLLFDLPLIELALFLQFAILSLGLKVILSVMALPRVMSLLSHTASLPLLSRIPVFHTHCATDRLFLLTDLATAVSHGNRRCLPRSLLLFWLSLRRRAPISLCLGVSKNLTSLEGHAWVEQDGVVLGDALSFINRYTLILRLPT